ncbi:MAG: 4Fe-4S dicluster domain-containing protein, partial [Desulfatiglandales bacterium]
PRKGKGYFPGRREIISGAVLGTFISWISTRKGIFKGDYQRSIMPLSLIRPPGSIPEEDFEIRCIRCGLCMVICPSNIIQPMGFQNGLFSLFSPVLVPRIGPCYPDCNLCGQHCPTGAIRGLSVEEKQWAKVGTAVILTELCIAYEWGRSCLVCDEACPYDAIEMIKEGGREVAVPKITESRCNGCGACEGACPVIPEKAIRVTAMGELRLIKGSFVLEGKRLGLDLGVKSKGHLHREGLPPGFSD